MKIIVSADDFGRQHSMNLAINTAMTKGMVFSTALIMGSEYTQEAVDLAFQGGYIQNVHCHLNLAACRSVGNHFVPLNEDFKKSVCCDDGEFGKASRYSSLRNCKYSDLVYGELESQYLAFREITRGKANDQHVDFHLYMNMRPAVAMAYSRLIKNYQIQSARFFGEHQRDEKEGRKSRIIRSTIMSINSHSRACIAKSCKFEYFLEYYDKLKQEEIMELYCHPDYVDGILLDRTPSAMGKKVKPLEENLAMVKERGDYEFISWASLNQ